MNKIGIIIAFYCLILLFSCSPKPDRGKLLSARVIQVISGQTVEVVLAETSEIAKVRIAGIDAPDLRQSPWGKEAKQRLSELVIGLPIKLELETPKRDRYHRLNAHIWQNQTNFVSNRPQ